MILGITGKSGTGKHTAAEFIRQKGWVVLDVDKIAHHLYRPYTYVWKAIVKRFGEGILNTDDVINRQKLGQIVFESNDPKALGDLNAIVHPAIREYLINELHHVRGKNVAIVAALWEEMELPTLCDKMLLTVADEKIAFERIRKRDGANEANFQARIKAQTTPEKPDFTVENNGSFPDLYKTLNSLGL